MTTIALKSNLFFPEGGCRCQMIDTDKKKKEQCTQRFEYPGEAQQTDKTDSHDGKTQIRFSCLT